MQIFIATDWTGRIDVTERVDRWRFRSLLPGGWWDADIAPKAPDRDLWELVNTWPGGTLTFHEHGEDLWSGRLSGARLGDRGLVLYADGKARELLDDETWRIYSDAGYRNWDRADNLPDGFSADNNNRVYVEMRSGASYTSGDEGTVTYPEDSVVLGADIVRIEAHVALDVVSGSVIGEIREDDGTVLWSATSDTETDVDLTVDSADGLVVALRATATGDAEASLKLTEVVVRTLYPTTSSDIVEDVLDDAGISGSVTASGVAADRAVYQGATPMAVLDDMAELGDGTESWVFSLYDDVAEFRAWADDADWLLVGRELEGWSLEWRLRDVVNAVRAEMPDGYRTAWVTDDDSIAHYQVRREETIRVPMTTQAEAARWAAIYLADHAWARASLRLSSGLWVRKPDGSEYPASFIRAGDVLTLRDLIPDSDETIYAKEIVVSDRGVDITPVGAANRLDVLLAARERRR